MTTEDYREAIVKAALALGEGGNYKAKTEDEVRTLLADLTDAELEEGMPFNAPEDVAEVIMSM